MTLITNIRRRIENAEEKSQDGGLEGGSIPCGSMTWDSGSGNTGSLRVIRGARQLLLLLYGPPSTNMGLS